MGGEGSKKQEGWGLEPGGEDLGGLLKGFGGGQDKEDPNFLPCSLLPLPKGGLDSSLLADVQEAGQGEESYLFSSPMTAPRK